MFLKLSALGVIFEDAERAFCSSISACGNGKRGSGAGAGIAQEEPDTV
jgi:hypothetical protein